MLGIREIASYIPEQRISNLDRMDRFETNEEFILEKIGIEEVSIKAKDEDTSDMAVKAYNNLEKKISINKSEVQVLILITQNPDSNIPHTSSVVHKKLELPESCAAFDISLGCSGFVYGLSIIQSFMESNNFKKGLLFTCDPYSKVINEDDKNTSFLFGDAATVTLITDDPVYISGKFTFGTIGKEGHNLNCDNNILFMNGRSIFNFAARYIPQDVKVLLEKNKWELDKVDKIIFHQGSKFILDTLIRRIGIPEEKVINDILNYGNTVSSSIPIILEKIIGDIKNKCILISGFGVGLSWSSNLLFRNS
ncbi:MAG: ketoacyl-ACP synthase III [Bacteroidales bacterium]|nr:ketoacyl-ACP synthase III [Bacteroidales bacterium]